MFIDSLQFKITDPVISFISVFVVNNLIGE